MKMHLPLGLRRALFNTFLALGIVAAMSTAQAAIDTAEYNAGTYHHAYSGSEGSYQSGSTIHTFGTENMAVSLGTGTYNITYDQLLPYTNDGDTFGVNEEGYKLNYNTPYAHLVVQPSIGGDGVTYITEGQVTINAASVTLNGFTDFNAGLITSCQVTLGSANTQYYSAGLHATYNGTNVIANGTSSNFTLQSATSLVAYNTEVTLLNNTLKTLTVNSPAIVNTKQELSLTSLTMNGGELNANAGITATSGSMSGGSITTLDSTLYLSGLAVSGGSISSNGKGTITVGGDITGGTFSGPVVTLGTAASTVTDTANPLSVSGGTLNLNGATTLAQSSSSIHVATLNVNADTQLTGSVEISSATNIAAGKTLTLSNVQDGSLDEVGLNGAASTGNLKLTNSTATATSAKVAGLEVGTGSALSADSVATSGAATINGTLEADRIELSSAAASTATNATIMADSLNVGQKLTISGGSKHDLGAVTGTELQLTSSVGEGGSATTAKADSVSVSTLGVASGSTLNSTSNIEATNATLAGTVTSTLGNISLGQNTTITGTVKAEEGTLTMAGGTATDATLAANEYKNTGNVTISGGTLDFEKTTVGKELTINGAATGGLGQVTVSGAGTVLDMDIAGTGLTGDITVSNGGTLELAGNHTGDISANNGGTLDFDAAALTGNVTLEGEGDTLNMTDSSISGTLTAGNGSHVNVTGTNTAGELVLDEASELNYVGNATLTTHVAVKGDSTANIGQSGLTGDLNVVAGTGNIAAGAQVTGNVNLYEGEVSLGNNAAVTGDITLSDEGTAHADRQLTIERDFSMAEDSALHIDTHAGSDHTGSNTIHMASGGTFGVQDLKGTGDVTLTGSGIINFAGDESDHSGNIVSELGSGSIIAATAENSLGQEGALVFEKQDSLLWVTADQQKDITINADLTLTTNGTAVELSGDVTGESLTLDSADLTLSGSGTELQQTTVGKGSTLTTTAGTYHNLTNNGELAMQDSTLGNLVNNSEATVTNSGVLADANITNSGELTLNKVSNARDEHDRDTVAGTLENEDGATLNIIGSDFKVTHAELAGTVNLAPSADGNETPTTLSSTEGTNVTGEVLGEGKLVSDATITVTGSVGSATDALVGDITAPDMVVDGGLVNLQGTVTTDSLTSTNGGDITISGDGDTDNASSSTLGNVLLEGASSLTMQGDSFTGDIIADGSTLAMEDARLTGSVQADAASEVALRGSNDFDVTAESSIAGAISGTGTMVKTGENLTLSGADTTPDTMGDYTIIVSGGAATSSDAPNSITLDGTQRNGTLEAEANTDIVLTGGKSTVGELIVYGDGNASHNTPSENATHLVVTEAGTDYLASATGTPLNAADTATETGETRGAQIIIKGWNVADTFSEYADGEKLLVAENIQNFDKEIVHGLDTQNVNLVEENGNSYAVVSINHKGAAKNKYQQGVSDSLVSAEAGATAELADMLEALRHTVSEQGSTDALNCIGGAGIATTMAAQMSASRDHMRTLRHSIGQPEALPYDSILGTAIRRTTGTAKPHEQQLQFPTRLWGMATGSSADLGSDRLGGAGYTRNDWGVLVGSDVTLSNRSLVGIAAGYSRSHVDSLNHTISGDQYFVDLYTRVNTRNMSHSATLGVGFFDWDLDRSVIINTADLYQDFVGQGKGQTKGMAFNFSYEAAYNIRLTEKQTLSPVFQVESSLNHINSYTENAGTLGNAGLNVGFDNAFVTTLGLGLHYSYKFEGFGSSERNGSLGARAMLIGDVGDSYGTMRGSFIGGGQHFEAESTRISRQGLLFGVDALVPVGKQWDIFGNADFEIRDDYRDISAGVGARYRF